MRRYRLFLCALLSLCLLSGCGSPAGETSQTSTTSQSVASSGEPSAPAADTSSKETNAQKDNSTDTSWQEAVSMTATADTSGAVTVTITNDSDQTITAGQAYELQRLEGSDWVDVPLSLVFTDEGIEIPSGGKRDFTSTLSLEAGSTYQVIKTVYMDQSELTLTATLPLS